MPLTGAPGVASAAGAFNVGAPFAYTQPTPPQIVKQPTSPSFATFTDDFTTQDTTKWSWGAGDSVSGGQLVEVPSSSYNSNLVSVATYDLTGSAAIVQLVQAPPVGLGSIETYMSLVTDTTFNNGLVFKVKNGSLSAYVTVSGGNTTLATVTYSAAAHQWLRVRESVGTVYFDTSPDRTTWTNQATWAPTIPVTALLAMLGTGYTAAETSPGTAVWDNFNTAPATPAAATGAITLGGSASAAGGATAGGAIALAGTASSSAASTATGTVTLTGSGSAVAGSVAAGTLTLGGSGSPQTTAAAAGAITLGGSGTARAAGAASGSITLAGSGAASAAATASAAITLAGTGTATPPGNNASGSLTLGGTATATGLVNATGSVTLGGTGAAAATASATGGITLGGAATASATTSSSGGITLAGAAQLSALANAAGTLTLDGLAHGTQGGLPVVLTPVSFTARGLAGHVTVRGLTGSLTGRRLAGSLAGRTVQGHLQEVT